MPTCLKPLISTLYNKVNDQLNIIGRKKKSTWVLRKNMFFLIVLYVQTLIIVFLFGILAHLDLYIKIKRTGT